MIEGSIPRSSSDNSCRIAWRHKAEQLTFLSRQTPPLTAFWHDVSESEPMNLERAIQIAVEAHAGQLDKAGQPYVLHSLRVMFDLQSDEERIVGVLHDVVEDCEGWSFDRLKTSGLSQTVLDALDSVTKRAGEDYMSFVRRAGANPIGRTVKMADLKDNMDLSRISEPSDRDYTRIAQYGEALAYLSTLR